MSTPLIRAAADYFRLSLADMLGPLRKLRVVKARAAAIYVMHARDGITYSQIGKRFSRDHTTIMSNFRRAQEWLKHDDDFNAFVMAQMALPKHAPMPAILMSPYPGPYAPSQVKKVLPPCPPNLVKLREDREAQEEEIVEAGCSRFKLDRNGLSSEERYEQSRSSSARSS